MAVYLIDYENVHDAGIVGIAKLTANDKVTIFCSANTKSLAMDTHISIVESKAKIEHIKTAKTAKNYLDFQLSTKLGYMIGKGEKGPYYIISKDTGFDSVVDYWQANSITIKRQEQIEPEKKTKAQNSKKTAAPAVTVVSAAPAITSDKNATVESIVSDSIASKPTSNGDKLPETRKKKFRDAIKKAKIKLEGADYTKIYKSVMSAGKASEYKAHLDEQFKDKQIAEKIYVHTQMLAVEYINANK